MTKTFLFLFSLFLFVSCGKSGGSESVTDGNSVSLDEISVDSPVPSAALNFEVNIQLDNFNSTQVNKILTASDLIKKVVGSEEFKKRVKYHCSLNFIPE